MGDGVGSQENGVRRGGDRRHDRAGVGIDGREEKVIDILYSIRNTSGDGESAM